LYKKFNKYLSFDLTNETKTGENLIYTLILILFLINSLIISIYHIDGERCSLVGGCKEYPIVGEDNQKFPVSFIIRSTLSLFIQICFILSLIYLEVWLSRGRNKESLQGLNKKFLNHKCSTKYAYAVGVYIFNTIFKHFLPET